MGRYHHLQEKGLIVNKTNRLIWMDLEMTGLDPRKDTILEVAIIITNNDLEIIEEGPDIIMHQSEERLLCMDTFVQTMHKETNLWNAVIVSNVSLQEAQQQILTFLKKHCVQGTAPLCGNSVWMDRFFLLHHMPEVYAFLHYRTIDVSTIKELVVRWDTSLEPFKKKKVHRALSDIHESIAELRYYRQKYFNK